MSKEDWIGHTNVEISENELGLHLKRKQTDFSFNYFCVLHQEPIDSHVIFKIHVESVYNSDRFVDFGIVNKQKFDEIKNGGFINRWNSGGISYCGYAHGASLTGKYPSTSASSDQGLKPGDHYYMNFEPGKEIKYYNDEGTIDLKMDMSSRTEEFYLFAVVYHP